MLDIISELGLMLTLSVKSIDDEEANKRKLPHGQRGGMIYLIFHFEIFS